MKTCSFLITATTAVILLFASFLFGQTYTADDLGTLSNGTYLIAYDLNDVRQVVGYGDTVLPSLSTRQHAFLWLPSPAYGLPPGLNDLGVILDPRSDSTYFPHV